MYIAPNFPAPITPMRSGLSFLSRSFAYRFISCRFQNPFELLGRGAVLPGKRDVVVPQQAVVGQRADRGEVAMRDVAGALEAPDVVRDRAEREVHAHAVPGRKVGAGSVDQAAVEEDHRARRALRRDDSAAIDKTLYCFLINNP